VVSLGFLATVTALRAFYSPDCFKLQMPPGAAVTGIKQVKILARPTRLSRNHGLADEEGQRLRVRVSVYGLARGSTKEKDQGGAKLAL
jgi:hypothetical protein